MLLCGRSHEMSQLPPKESESQKTSWRSEEANKITITKSLNISLGNCSFVKQNERNMENVGISTRLHDPVIQK